MLSHVINTVVPVIISAYDSGWYFGPIFQVNEAVRTVLELFAYKGNR